MLERLCAKDGQFVCGRATGVDIHGNTLTMENQRDLSQFDDIAEENGVVAVWPQGHDNSWNSGYCCSTAGEMQLNDTGLILEIIDKVVANHSIDESRIYLTGWSNGCSLSQNSPTTTAKSSLRWPVCPTTSLMTRGLSIRPYLSWKSTGWRTKSSSLQRRHSLPNLDAQKHGAIQNLCSGRK